MALYIDFNFINIRDLVDLSEVDLEFENQLQDFVEQVFENSIENNSLQAEDAAQTVIKFISDSVAENVPAVKSDVEAFVKTESAEKPAANVIAEPVKPTVSAPKPTVNKNDAYIKYISSKYDQSQAEYFINVLLNPVQTHLKNRFDYADLRNSYLKSQILGKDKTSTDKTDEFRRRQDEKMRNAENQRQIESLKQIELKKLFEQKNKARFQRV